MHHPSSTTATARGPEPRAKRRQLRRRRRLGQALVIAGGLLASLPLVAQTASALPAVTANPDLPAACGIDVTLVLDRSGSIEGYEDQVESAAQSLVDAFADTGSRFKLVTFATTATGADASGNETATLADVVFRDAEDVTIPTDLDGEGSTNWDDALEVVRRSPGAGGDLVVFVTDGNPTSRNSGSGGSDGDEALDDGHGNGVSDDGSGASTSTGEVDEAMSEANALKGAGSHVFAIGVGSGISATNLGRVTGPDVYDGTPPPTINESDYTLLGQFDQLASAFRAVVIGACGGTIEVVKDTVPDSGQSFGFSLFDDQDVLQGSLSQADGDAAESFGSVPPGTYSVEETPVTGWTQTSATCDDTGTDAVEQVAASAVVVGPQETWRCTFVNTANKGSITVVKHTVGDPTGSFDFTRSFGAGFTLDTVGGTAQTTFSDLAVGEYAVAESAEPGWTLQSATCDNGETVDDIDVGPGEAITCTFTNAPASLGLEVTKTADPTSLPEPGGLVTYTVGIQNTSPVAVTLDTITDSPFAIPAESDCTALIGTSLAAGDDDPTTTDDSATCTFQATISDADAGDVVADTVTVTGHRSDDADQTVQDSDSAEVTITDALPTATAAKGAAPTSLEAPGGLVTYTISTTNTSDEVLTVTAIEDQIEGGAWTPVAVGGVIQSTDCAVGAVLDPGESYQCSFVASVSGVSGDVVDDTIRFTLVDDEENEVQPTDPASVTITAPFDQCPNLPGTQPRGADCTPPPTTPTTEPPTTEPPVDECPDDPGFQTNPDQCTQVEPTVITTPSTQPPATPTTQGAVVQGEVVARPQQLPRTGGEPWPFVQLGLGMVLLGLGAVVAGRERGASS